MTRPVEMLLLLYAESPVHAGANESIDVIDLPIQREASTGYPVIWGQSLKGALRQAAEDAQRAGGSAWTAQLVRQVFGSAVGTDGEESAAGLLMVGDAQLVAMPVPALRRTFAWVTSGMALARLARKYRTLGRPIPPTPAVAPDRGLAAGAAWTTMDQQVLGPCVVPLETSEEVKQWAGRLAADAIGPADDPVTGHFHDKFVQDLLLVGDDTMPQLVRECTELNARVQLDDGKTVAHGPFYSEYLPAETVLAASLTLREPSDASRAAVRELLGGAPLQVGGDETLGKGLMWARLEEAG
ncbi:type III-B CRISPR module RAMP protein Cmr4 [Actinomadura sp. CNU-125]|uniref:type III-B CRISPR module RAMP protein Cmr4 n=1 Tax=Actinomadura sp. CNU-125 TaxID=1904961 RepID=UPI000A7F80DF|nr:type III-B CRISPR module RAMP protein Cmr4 [Actinomadura sp. CNU-125]